MSILLPYSLTVIHIHFMDFHANAIFIFFTEEVEFTALCLKHNLGVLKYNNNRDESYEQE